MSTATYKRGATYTPYETVTQSNSVVTPYKAPAKPKAVPKPKAAVPAKPKALPLDPTYISDIGGLKRTYDTTIAGLQYQQGQVQQDYGFDDTSNPFNRAAMLQRSYQQSQTGGINRMAAAGQLYSGAAQRGQDEGTYNYNRSYSDLRRSYDQAQHDITQRRAEAATAAYTGAGSALGASVDRAVAARTAEDPGVTTKPTTAQTRAAIADSLHAQGVIRAKGIGGGKYKLRLSSGELVTARTRPGGVWEVFKGGKWKRFN